MCLWLLCQVYDANLPTLFEETWCKSTNPWNLTLLEISSIVYIICVWFVDDNFLHQVQVDACIQHLRNALVILFKCSSLISSPEVFIHSSTDGHWGLAYSILGCTEATLLYFFIWGVCFNKMINGIPDMLVSIPGTTMMIGWQLKGSRDYKLPFHFA